MLQKVFCVLGTMCQLLDDDSFHFLLYIFIKSSLLRFLDDSA